MTKDDFLNALLSEGFICEKGGQYPSVVCDAKDVRKTAKKVKAIAKQTGYNSSFAIRSFREGMELISKDGAVVKADESAKTVEEASEDPVSIAEPFPMTAIADDVSA